MSEHFDFEVIPSDDPTVRDADKGFLVEVSWAVTAPEGGKSHGVRRVLVTADMGAIVHLGLLAQPEPVPPYTGGYALAPDLAAEVATRAAADAALDGRVDALEVAPPAHTHPLADVTDAGTAAASDVGDFATAAQGVKADSASQPGHAHAGGDITSGTVAYARLPVGTAASTLAAGDDSRITGAAQKSANLSDLASASTARTNLGLTDAAVVGALPIPDPGSFYPTDTLTAALQLIGGRHIYGTGSPEGVVTAPVGTYYTDTALTNGALRWAKKTGSGNTGWQVIEGDTGWRNVGSGILNGWTVSTLHVRRINALVTWRVFGLTGLATWADVLAIPTGFAPVAATYCLGRENASTGNTVRFAVTNTAVGAGGGQSKMIEAAWNSAAYSMSGEPVHECVSAWPTTLPGTAAV